jgi:hypothetical protein
MKVCVYVPVNIVIFVDGDYSRHFSFISEEASTVQVTTSTARSSYCVDCGDIGILCYPNPSFVNLRNFHRHQIVRKRKPICGIGLGRGKWRRKRGVTLLRGTFIFSYAYTYLMRSNRNEKCDFVLATGKSDYLFLPETALKLKWEKYFSATCERLYCNDLSLSLESQWDISCNKLHVFFTSNPFSFFHWSLIKCPEVRLHGKYLTTPS